VKYLAEYKKYVDETILYDSKFNIIMIIMRDVTTETLEKSKRQISTAQTIEVTDQIIEKQMRSVQEIASLLGETTAETKVALIKLKESLNDKRSSDK
ncbi:MAG: histidine kinase, partial [Bacilli bacterium]